MARSTPAHRLVALSLLTVVPWTLLLVGGDPTTLVFPLAFLSVESVTVLWLWEILRLGGGLPRNPLLLPLSAVLYLGALASAAVGLADREDPRLTAGLLVLAGLSHLGVAYSLVHRLRYTPIPAGVMLVFVAAWWFYWPELRALALAPGDAET